VLLRAIFAQEPEIKRQLSGEVARARGAQRSAFAHGGKAERAAQVATNGDAVAHGDCGTHAGIRDKGGVVEHVALERLPRAGGIGCSTDRL
jgi:hypothetical protein